MRYFFLFFIICIMIVFNKMIMGVEVDIGFLILELLVDGGMIVNNLLL